MSEIEPIEYDEFGLFHENAAEYGLSYAAPPMVRRVSVALPGGRRVSALLWGDRSPEIVFLHGGAQNAHTWDTVVLSLGRPALAVDLPGHGHSDWRDDGGYTPATMADDVAVVIEQVAPAASVVVGMSMGGMTSIALASRHAHLVRRLVLVDITPGVDRAKTKAITDFINGPQAFPSFQSLLDRTIEHNPTRTISSLRRGILHNARQLDDGSWQWRYDRSNHHGRPPEAADDLTPGAETGDATVAVMHPLWDDFGAIGAPLMLVRGSLSPVVDDADVAEARRRQPTLRVEVVVDAGHSIQGDRPLELARLLDDFAPTA